MTKLIQCVECNKPVSSDFYTCPHCEMPPRGVVCHICLEPLKKSDAAKFFGLNRIGSQGACFENHHGYQYPGLDIFVHKSCQGKIRRDLDLIDNKKSVDCLTCNNSVLVHNFYLDFSGKKIERSHKLVCKNCGHRFEQIVYDSPLVECTYCDFPVEKDAAIKISLPYATYDKSYLPFSNQANTPHHAHKICYAPRRQEIALEHHDAFELQKKVDIKENNQSSKESKSREISHTIYRLCNFLLTVIAPIYFVYALITGNAVGIAFFIATIGFLGMQLNSSSPKQNVKAHKQKINTLPLLR